jgi:hypothetical protein
LAGAFLAADVLFAAGAAFFAAVVLLAGLIEIPFLSASWPIWRPWRELTFSLRPWRSSLQAP